MSVEEIVKFALLEDLSPNGDLTSLFLINEKSQTKAKIIAKEEGVLACSHVAQLILSRCASIYELDISPQIHFHLNDGEIFQKGQCIASIEGSARVILSAERTLLNFLQRLCGVAVATRKLVNLIKDYPQTKLLDTRKTQPGLRSLEKEAFRAGGGTNHRYNLSDMVLIKENHLNFFENSSGEINLISAIKNCKEKLLKQRLSSKIECEINKDFVSTAGNLEKLLLSGLDIIMLDNFSPEEALSLVKDIRILEEKLQIPQKIQLEVSGGINSENILNYAKSGVDFISTGSVTTQARNVDLSLLICHKTS